MKTTKNARPSAGTPERATTETAAFGRAAISSCNHFNTAAAGRQIKVADMLSRGRENAVPLRHLQNILESDGRTIRLMIEKERRSGIPICADNTTGYYLPSTADEKAACVRSMRHRAGEILKTARAIERGVDRSHEP